MKVKKETVSELPVQFTDLRSITRNSRKCLTLVSLKGKPWDTRGDPWLLLGETQIRSQRDRIDSEWRLEARLSYGVTDFEHDSAYALRLPLIGLTFTGVDYHASQFIAWVDPNRWDGFHVPLPGYNPMKLPKTRLCKAAECKGDKPWPHPIVPEGYYVPPFNESLFLTVRGKPLIISIGPSDKTMKLPP